MIDTTCRGWKKKSKEWCQGILHGTPLLESVNFDGECYLRNLIQLHPEAEQKIGCGIHHFVVRPNEYKGRTFWIVRIDGSETDFSFTRCISDVKPMTDFAKACRTAVTQEILDFKNMTFDICEFVVCPISGERITRDSCHVDHTLPTTFKWIVDEFAKTLSDHISEVEETKDGEVVTRFRDEHVAEAFRAFHRKHAKLRVVSIRSNLSTLRKGSR